MAFLQQQTLHHLLWKWKIQRCNYDRLQISSLLNNLAWQVVEAPATAHGKEVVLEGSDVLFTGKEIFVGIRKNGTNMEGALVGCRFCHPFHSSLRFSSCLSEQESLSLLLSAITYVLCCQERVHEIMTAPIIEKEFRLARYFQKNRSDI